MIRTLRSLLLLALSAATSASAADRVYATESGAIGGYDAVAYHTEGRPVRGRAEWTQDWNGATWRFASAANRDAFAADPARFAPAYGGFCAYGTSRGYKVSTAPEAFDLVDGRLYLNHSVAVQATWRKDRPGYIAAADAAWPTLEEAPYEP